ncbi:MAG: 2-oxoacid:ferredoxin oxidoreductase subunit gamma [Ruminococcaceae bacterium]|nr:2-oxoacid:ferredoxin oxidoreductase subunit gamma [Oscillospiraceae bacterium]
MSTNKYLFAGFGGQGILFSGKLLAYKGLTDGKNVSWLPSYGPEMRGGTASCSVIISDTPVGSPIVSKPDILIAMNLPSLDKYENDVAEGGMIFYDSSLIEREVIRKDVRAFAIPATKLADDNMTPTLANIIMVGKVLKETGEFDEKSVEAALRKVISAKHIDMLDKNLDAMKIGRDF